MADNMVFEPGPSFVENEPPTERLTEMPAWLQTFAAAQESALETSNASQEVAQEPNAQPESLPNQVEPDATLPAWLRADPDHPEPVAQVDTLGDFDNFEEPVENGADTFISEDDLPDWLRAFSHETSAVPARTSMGSSLTAAPNTAAASGATMVRVPPVESVWLSASDRKALGPGRTLFALLASNGGVVTFSEATGTNDTDHSNDAANVGSGKTPGNIAHSPDAATAEGTADQPRNSMRILLLALFVVLLIVFVSVSLL